MGPTSTSTYWVACRLSVELPDDDLDYDFDGMLWAMPDLLSEEGWLDLESYQCEAVFRVAVIHGSSPQMAALAALRRALAGSVVNVEVTSLLCERQADVLARLHEWTGCRQCGTRHRAKRCLQCGDCLERMTDELLAA